MSKQNKKNSGRLNSYLLSIMTIGLVVFGWLNVYLQFISLQNATTTAFQEAALEIVQSTARAAKVYMRDQLKIRGLTITELSDTELREIETEFFETYVDPIELLDQAGDAWIIGWDNEMVFDQSIDFPYFGMPIDEFLPKQAQAGGACDYEDMLDDVLNRRENVGQYIWDENKGWEYGAWTPAVVSEERDIKWMIGLTTPLTAILDGTGVNESIRESAYVMAAVTLVVGIVFFSFLAGQRQVRALQEQVVVLQIQIDETKKEHEVKTIVESEYFQDLKKRASELRAGGKRQSSACEENDT